MQNGKGPDRRAPDEPVVSLAEARRRRDEQVRKLRAATGVEDRPIGASRRSLRELLVGAVLVLLAVAMIASYVAPLFSR